MSRLNSSEHSKFSIARSIFLCLFPNFSAISSEDSQKATIAVEIEPALAEEAKKRQSDVGEKYGRPVNKIKDENLQNTNKLPQFFGEAIKDNSNKEEQEKLIEKKVLLKAKQKYGCSACIHQGRLRDDTLFCKLEVRSITWYDDSFSNPCLASGCDEWSCSDDFFDDISEKSKLIKSG